MQSPLAAHAAEKLRRARTNPTATLVVRRIPAFGGMIVGVCLLLPARAPAQQFVTDDAAMVDLGACQLEAWHGEASSWILPACQPLRGLEITPVIGFIPDDGGRTVEYVFQAKYLLRELGPNDVGFGVVGGLGFGPLSQVSGDGVAQAFAFVPLSASVADDRLILHGNLGWQYEGDRDDRDGVANDRSHHALTWAARGDVLVAERISLIAELFGEHGGRPQYQLGLRGTALPERVQVDVSWGGHTARGHAGPGSTFGVAWTPPPFH